MTFNEAMVCLHQRNDSRVLRSCTVLGETHCLQHVRHYQHDCDFNLPGWVLTPLVHKQVDAKAAALDTSDEKTKRPPIADKEHSLQFTTPPRIWRAGGFLLLARCRQCARGSLESE